MNRGKTIFAQLMEFISPYEFRKYVNRYKGHYKVLRFTCWEQFLCMVFAQLTYRESLRDIEVCLRTMGKKLYHLGIRSTISRNTLAHANEKRDWRIYRDLGQQLIKRATSLYADDDFSLSLKNVVYALDSTTIELCMSLFPWASYSKNQAAVKMHTLLNLRGNIPSLVIITSAFVSDIEILKRMTLETDAFYIIDRAYFDFETLFNIDKARAFFIIRMKKNIKFKRIYSFNIDKTTGVRCDQIIKITSEYARPRYPKQLRRIKYYDQVTNKYLTFATNNTDLEASTICHLYRYRWQIELFFKWIKQHLRIKAFFGRSENAIKTQIWIAVSTYVLVAIIKKELNIRCSLHTMLQIFSISIFDKVPILEAFSNPKYQETTTERQMPLF
jgi:transposase